jgi:hypothetical protein
MIKHNLHKGAHVFKVLSWCEWAVNSGHVEYIYDGDEMIGFMDWIRSTVIPYNHDYQRLIDSGDVDSGEVGIVLNTCVVRGKDTLKKLIKMVRSKGGPVKVVCWHDRKADRMRQFCWQPHMAKTMEVSHAA